MAKMVGLVLEGGGMRGSYTLGILDVFLENRLFFPYVIGVSAGACNAASYVSRQIGRGERIAETYGMDRRYVSPLNLLGREHSMFGMDFIFDEIPDVHDPFDYDAFYRTGTRMVIGCTDVVTGKALYVDTPPRATLNTYYRASSSIPLFSPMVRVDGYTLLDGGTADPIPFDEALRHCDKVIVVLTRGREYVKKPAPAPWIYRRALRAYPNMSRTCADRHRVYNDQRARLADLVAAGKALAFYPDRMDIDVFERRPERLHAVYANGRAQAQARLAEVRAFLAGSEMLPE